MHPSPTAYCLQCWTFNLLYQLSTWIMWSPQGWVVLWVKTTQQQNERGQRPDCYYAHSTSCARSVMLAVILTAGSARFCCAMFQNQHTLKEYKITDALKQLKTIVVSVTYLKLCLFMKSKTSGSICKTVWVMYLSSNNAIATVEVFAVHVHGASFALCNTSPPSCRYIYKKMIRQSEKFKSSTNDNFWLLNHENRESADSEFVHTSKLSHYLFYCPSPGVGVSMSTVRSNEVVWQINGCLNTNCAGFLKAKPNIWLECT